MEFFTAYAMYNAVHHLCKEINTTFFLALINITSLYEITNFVNGGMNVNGNEDEFFL